MAEAPDNVDLQWIARTLTAMQDDMRSINDQLLVQSGILIRLEHRDRTADGTRRPGSRLSRRRSAPDNAARRRFLPAGR